VPATTRRAAVALVLATLLIAVGCTSSGGSKEKFCAELPKTGDVLSILSDFESTDPALLVKRFDAGLEEYRNLERAAPREIRADVARLADAVELVLDVVRKHPDDLGAIRTELGANAATLATAGKAALTVGDYAQDECGQTLPGGDPGGDIVTTTTAATTSTTG